MGDPKKEPTMSLLQFKKRKKKNFYFFSLSFGNVSFHRFLFAPPESSGSVPRARALFGMKRSGGRIAESVTVIGGAAAKPADAEPYGA